MNRTDAPPPPDGALRLTAAEIAALVGGRVEGDSSAAVVRVAPLDRATPDALSILGAARYAAAFATTKAGIVLVTPELAASPGAVAARIIVDKPQEVLLSLLPRFYRQPQRPAGIHATAVLGRGVQLGDAVSIGPGTVIGDGAVIGDNAWIEAHCVIGAGVSLGSDVHCYPGVTLYSGTTLGHRVAIHAGARIGSDGFGYVYRDGAHQKIPHVGRCVVEDDVEIGANTCIDRGSIDDTVIGAGTRIDNLVHIAHNVRIGKLCLIMAQVGIAGSVHVGDGCILAGQVGVSGHHTIGSRATLAAQAGVFGDIPAGETWSGYPARPHKEQLRAHAALFKLSGLIRKLERLVEGGS